MGRPPLGDVAMTDAQRQAKRKANLLAAASAGKRDYDKLSAEVVRLQAALAQAQQASGSARVRELEARIRSMTQAHAAEVRDLWETHKSHIAILRETIAVYERLRLPIDQAMVRKLIRLCHPDLHRNSAMANEVTQFLLTLRTKS